MYIYAISRSATHILLTDGTRGWQSDSLLFSDLPMTLSSCLLGLVICWIIPCQLLDLEHKVVGFFQFRDYLQRT